MKTLMILQGVKFTPWTNRMPNKIMMTAADIMEELSVSESFAYGLIRKFNAELKEKGFTIIRGKISRKYGYSS